MGIGVSGVQKQRAVRAAGIVQEVENPFFVLAS